MRRQNQWGTAFAAALLAALLLAAACVSAPRAQVDLERTGFLPFISHGGPAQPTPVPGALIVNHFAPAAFEDMPDDARLGAIDMRLLVRHASVGENINAGLDDLAGLAPDLYDRASWDFQARGNPGWQAKIDDLVTQTALQEADFDGFTMKFCYIDALGEDSPDWPTYREAMLGLERDYPDKTIIWWTIPLTSGGNAGADRFNNLVRDYARQHGVVLFDIADIETHDPAGVRQTSAAGNEVLYPDYTDDGGHLNQEGRLRVAKAWWVLVARLNGWTW